MKRYKYIEIYASSLGIRLLRAELELVEQMATMLRKHIPSCAVKPLYDDVDQKPLGYALHKLGNKDYMVVHWLLRQLCCQGWEPFACTHEGRLGITYHCNHHLRLEFTDPE